MSKRTRDSLLIISISGGVLALIAGMSLFIALTGG